VGRRALGTLPVARRQDSL